MHAGFQIVRSCMQASANQYTACALACALGLRWNDVVQATGLGLGPDSRFLRLEANCVYTHLDINEVVEKYKRSSRRVILLDYGSAYAPHSLVCRMPVP